MKFTREQFAQIHTCTNYCILLFYSYCFFLSFVEFAGRL